MQTNSCDNCKSCETRKAETSSCKGVIAHSLPQNIQTRRDINEHLQMNAPVMYMRRPSSQSGAAKRCALAIAPPKTKWAGGGGPAGLGPGRVPRPRPPALTPWSPPRRDTPLRNPQSTRELYHELGALLKKDKHNLSRKLANTHLFIY